MQRAKEVFRETNNTTLGIVAFAIILMLMLFLPQVSPTSRFGMRCSSLANPIPGGNNQPLLAARSAGKLELSLELPRRNLGTTDELTVNVTFHNTGVGAVTLFFVPSETLLRNDGTPGLSIEIARLPDRTIFSEPTTIRPPNPNRQTFPIETLHVLGPRQRCTETITFSYNRVANLGLQPGNYAVRAIYRNATPGALNVPAYVTATPIFNNQGVYTTQELSSNFAEFTVGLVAQQQPGEAQPLGG